MCWWCRGNIFKAMIFFTKKSKKRISGVRTTRSFLFGGIRPFSKSLLAEPCLSDDIGLSPLLSDNLPKKGRKEFWKEKTHQISITCINHRHPDYGHIPVVAGQRYRHRRQLQRWKKRASRNFFVHIYMRLKCA
jgi:hypothetical protein